MEDLLEIIASIAGVVIYFFLSQRGEKQKKKPAEPVGSTPPPTPAPPPVKVPKAPKGQAKPKPSTPPTTFEEILRQYGTPQPYNPPKEDKMRPSEERSLERTAFYVENYDQDPSQHSYIRDGEREKTGNYAEKRRANPYAEYFRHPDNIRKAFIAAEILKRPEH